MVRVYQNASYLMPRETSMLPPCLTPSHVLSSSVCQNGDHGVAADDGSRQGQRRPNDM